MRYLDLSGATLKGASCAGAGDNAVRLDIGTSGGWMRFPVAEGMLEGMKYLVYDVFLEADHSLCMTIDFFESDQGDESQLWIKTGVLPGVWTRMALPLETLSSRRMFIPPTPGGLKTVVFGKPLPTEEVRAVAIGSVRCHKDVTLILKNPRLQAEEPVFELPDDVKLVDRLGQFKPKPWKNTFADENEMTAYMRALYAEAKAAPEGFANPDFNAYGGYKHVKRESTGFFRTERIDGKWFLIDPEGCPFFSLGLDCIGTSHGRITGLEPYFEELPARDDPLLGECYMSRGRFYDGDAGQEFVMYDFLQANLRRAFGADAWREAFYTIVKYFMLKWGFNTIANWSDRGFVRWAQLPYVFQPQGFPETAKKIFRDFPDVFSPEYESNARTFAAQLEEIRDDRFLIGYFMRNEPVWAFVEELCIAEEMLFNGDTFVTKDLFIEEMRGKYKDITAFNAAWKLSLADFDGLRAPIRRARSLSEAAAADLDAFSLCMYERYNAVPAAACRKAAPNHMNLGLRYGYISQPGLVEGWQSFDVFSINCYSPSPAAQAEQAQELMDIPVMVGEYHFGSLESGLTATGLRAVATQKDRGIAYRYFVEQGAALSNFTGAHYFTIFDQTALGRFDGENYQIGLIDNCMRPYDDFIAGIVECHNVVYKVALGQCAPFDEKPAEIPKIAF